MPSDSFTIDVSELAAMATRYADGAHIMDEEVSAAARASGFAVEGQAKVYAPVLTGFLRSTIATHPPRSVGGEVETIVSASAEYARTAEEGFPPARAGLRGRRPHPYLVRALHELETSFIRDRFAEATRRTMARLAAPR